MEELEKEKNKKNPLRRILNGLKDLIAFPVVQGKKLVGFVFRMNRKTRGQEQADEIFGTSSADENKKLLLQQLA